MDAFRLSSNSKALKHYSLPFFFLGRISCCSFIFTLTYYKALPLVGCNPRERRDLAQEQVHPVDIHQHLLVQVELKEKRAVNYL